MTFHFQHRQKFAEYRDGEFKSYEITPEQFGFTRCKKEDLVGGEPAANAQIAREILDGVEGPKMGCGMT